jgi:hypothetical protein
MTQQTLSPRGRGEPSPRATLAALRFTWAAMLAAQAVLFMAIERSWEAGRFSARPDLSRTLFLINVGLFVAVLATAWFLRRSIARPHVDGLIPPRSFFAGTIVFIALCELPTIFGILSLTTSSEMWPTALVPTLAFLIQLMNFPSGSLVRGIGDAYET